MATWLHPPINVNFRHSVKDLDLATVTRRPRSTELVCGTEQKRYMPEGDMNSPDNSNYFVAQSQSPEAQNIGNHGASGSTVASCGISVTYSGPGLSFIHPASLEYDMILSAQDARNMRNSDISPTQSQVSTNCRTEYRALPLEEPSSTTTDEIFTENGFESHLDHFSDCGTSQRNSDVTRITKYPPHPTACVEDCEETSPSKSVYGSLSPVPWSGRDHVPRLVGSHSMTDGCTQVSYRSGIPNDTPSPGESCFPIY